MSLLLLRLIYEKLLLLKKPRHTNTYKIFFTIELRLTCISSNKKRKILKKDDVKTEIQKKYLRADKRRGINNHINDSQCAEYSICRAFNEGKCAIMRVLIFVYAISR